jgi:DNA-binding response OmpR family regulator
MKIQPNKTVVYIEDDPDMIRLVKFVFERNEFKLIGALGGHEGLRTVRRIKPDLVLLDLMMPGVDGLQVYQQMKADDELKNIPIIVVTVVGQNSDQVQDLQVHDYVRKPFIPRELVQRVNKALGLTQHPSTDGQKEACEHPSRSL